MREANGAHTRMVLMSIAFALFFLLVCIKRTTAGCSEQEITWTDVATLPFVYYPFVGKVCTVVYSSSSTLVLRMSLQKMLVNPTLCQVAYVLQCNYGMAQCGTVA